jgi:hypothetical protein
MADYWYAPVITFWSDREFGLVPQTCAPTSQGAQFTQQKGSKSSALIIDRGGLNYAFWGCTDQHLIETYGTPDKKLEVPGVSSNPVQIWVYNGGR